MTRKMMLRLMLAMRMLPNFAAYWWLLPRRMKHVRTRQDLMLSLMRERNLGYLLEQIGHARGVMPLLFNADPMPITRSDFRIPLRRFV